MSKFWKHSGLFWVISEEYDGVGSVTRAYGPYCPKCRADMYLQDKNGKLVSVADDVQEIFNSSVICINPDCKHTVKLDDSVGLTRIAVTTVFDAKQREGWEVEALDIPPGKVSDKDDEDENYWVSANMGQHKGNKMGVIYFGDKVRRGTKAQLFIDFEDELVRFDKGDRNPLDVACKVTVEFPNSKQVFEKRAKKNE